MGTSKDGYVLAIDQGTTSSRAIVFDAAANLVASDQREFTQHFPKSGWVEHDPNEIWESVVATCKGAIEKAGISASELVGVGITNQRETTIVWDRETGKPISNAIVWQDRRTSDVCDQLRTGGHEALITRKTGLLADPYFSGTKIAWILDRVDGARAMAEAGRLAFGTVDSFLIYKLTGGKQHVTDATNASRTMLYNIETGAWDEELAALLRVPMAVLPEVLDCAADFGVCDAGILGTEVPICGVAGDQQAATIGQACFSPGMMKSTYGTGCFALMNTGAQKVASDNRLLTTIAYQLGGEVTYALEGSIFIAGAAVQWLRDGLGIIEAADETGSMAARADEHQDVYLVPAFTGLGAPYWDAESRGAMFGLTRATGPNEFARAALEAVCYQTRDLVEAMRADWQGAGETALRVDGGMAASDWTMQQLAGILGCPIARPVLAETTALGAAYLAGLQTGLFSGLDDITARWRQDRAFEPQMDEATREAKYAGWQNAVSRTLSNHGGQT